jgi:hypothetical protein
MMDSKKILVYDNQHCLAIFLKYKFGKNYDFVNFKKIKEKEEDNLSEKEFWFVFFVIYSEIDLYDFVRIYNKGIPVIVASYNIEILKKMSHLNNVLLFDISLKKNEITDNFSNLFCNEFLAIRNCKTAI